jgi:hypothetical protein
MKINLREIFLIVLVVAIALGWWIDRKGLRRENDQLCVAAGKLARLLTYHGWSFSSPESGLTMRRGKLETSVKLPTSQARKINFLAETRVEPRLDPLNEIK